MPYPRRSYATPEETFGITRKPLNDWLDFAASGLPRQGAAFSTELEDADIRNQQRELQSMQLQRDLASEQAASNFLSQAAGKNPQGLMRMLADSPEILGSKDAPMIQDYVSQRQAIQQERQAKQPLSNKTLGPAIAKSITDPIQRMRFQQRLEAGEEATAAYEGIQSEAKMQSQQAARQKAVYDAIAEGAIDAADADVILNSENPDLAIAEAKGRAKRAGKSGGDDMSISEIIKLQRENMNDFGEVINPDVATYLDAQLKRAIAPRNVQPNPSTGAVVSLESFNLAAEQAKLDAARRDDYSTQPDSLPIAPVPAPPKALSAEERRREQASQIEAARLKQEELSKAEKARDLNEAWTSGKDRAMTSTGVTGDIAANKLTQMAQQMLLGETPKTASKQEQELAQKLADYAARAAAGENIVTGVTNHPYGQRDVLRSPGFAFIEELGGDPTELIEIKGSGIGGANRKIPAYQLMDFRLKEIATPMQQRQSMAKQQTKAAELDASEEAIIEAELAKGRIGQTKTN